MELRYAQLRSNKNRCVQVCCRYTVYHTENSNHLDQNIGIIGHKRSMLVNDNTVQCNVSQEEETITKLSTMAL